MDKEEESKAIPTFERTQEEKKNIIPFIILGGKQWMI